MEGLVEVPPKRPGEIHIKLPKKTPYYLLPSLSKEAEGKAHTVVFMEEGVRVDGKFRTNPSSIEQLKSFFIEINPGYCQCFKEEMMVPIAKCLSDSQRSDLKEVGECDLGDGDLLERMGQVLVYKEKHCSSFRNYTLTNVIHLNNFQEVPENKIVESVLGTAIKLEENGLRLTTLSTVGAIARTNLLSEAEDAFFPLWKLNPKLLLPFYDSIKGPDFRNFVVGDSEDTIDSDIHLAYPHIALYTPSTNPSYNNYIESNQYHPEASFCSCLIWINLSILEVMPLGVRVSRLLFTEETFMPLEKTYIVHPYGKINSVRVNLPTLWYLVEVLKLRLGKDLGIIEGVWVIPKGNPYYPLKNWARKVINCSEGYEELKFLGHRALTGGIFRKAVKTGEFQYKYENWALPTENPILLSHLFDIVKILVLLGSSSCKNIKGIAADGWVSKGKPPDSIGPIRIGSSYYGPFPIRNTPLELYYQFDQIRHDKITNGGKGEFWRLLSKEYYDKPEITYKVKGAITFNERGFEDPKEQGKEIIREYKFTPSTGENIPREEVKRCGDTLEQEVKTSPPHISEVGKRLPYIRIMKPEV